MHTIATPTLVSSAKSDADTAQQEIKNKNIRMYHPWSSLTDEGPYYYYDCHDGDNIP